MTLVGIPQQQQDAVFRLVAAVLHLGNLSFQEATDIETSTIQVALFASRNTPRAPDLQSFCDLAAHAGCWQMYSCIVFKRNACSSYVRGVVGVC